MPVRFDTPHPEKRFYNVVILDAGTTYIVRFGSDKRFYRKTGLHYLVDFKRMVPCQHEECKHCHTPIRVSTYVPALLYVPTPGVFKPIILPVGEAWEDVLAEDVSANLFKLKRKNGKNSQIVWQFDKPIDPSVGEWAGFDIEPSLWRAWGQHGKAG